MLTQQQIQDLKQGEKLIFYKNGNVKSAKQGNVFTFSNWFKEKIMGKHYWQCQELHEIGNEYHNFSIYDVELFDPNKHKNYIIMNEKIKNS